MERASDYLKDLERSRKELNAVLDEVEERLGELRQDAQEMSEQLSLFDEARTYNAFPFRQSLESSNDERSG